MVLSGPPTSLGGSQNVSFSSQNTYRAGHPQLGGGMNVLGNMSSFMGGEGQAFGNGGSLVNMQQGSIDSGAELDRLGNNGFSYDGDNSPCSSGQFQGQPLAMPEPPSSQHMEQQSFQQQFSLPPKTQGKQQFEMVKLEQQMINEQLGPTNPQERFQSIKNLAHHVKSDAQPMHLQQQQQQQFLQQQLRMFQIQQWQQQQQQLVKGAQPRGQLVQQQNSPVRSPVKSGYEPGMCARRVTMYMFHQQQRPDDNNIDFWRKFVNEYYAPNARKKWCVSMYGNGRQPSGVFPQDIWHCDICNRNPGRGFEATFEVLPRLLKIKYDSGTLEELLYIDMPREYQNSSGQIVLDYAKAIQESVFEQLRVVREGQLRILFSAADLKICSWEFCARRHEELIPRRLLIPQISQLGVAAQKYQTTAQNASPTVSELQNNCNMFLSSARQLAKALEVPLVNDLGYTKRYVRCLQISEVVNCMKDLMDYSRDTGAGPIESLAKFSRRSSGGQSRQPEEQSEQQSEQQPPTATAQNMPPSVHSSNGVGPASTTSSTIAALIQQNSMNSRHHQSSSVSTARNPYGLTFQSPPQHSSPTEISMSENQSSQSSSSSFAVQKILQEMMSRQLSSSVHGSAMRVGLGQSQTAIANGPGLRAAGAARVGMGMGAVVSERSMSLRQQQELSNQMLIGGFNNHLQHDWRFP